jgi:RNA polymerase sigma factor (sigma-70 family)
MAIMGEKSDHELVGLALSGDQEAFGILAERHQDVALRIARKMVMLEEVAQDLVQESLLEAYLALNRLRDRDKFRSWLIGIMLNMCKGYLRENRRHGLLSTKETKSIDFDPFELYSIPPDPQKVAEEREFQRLVFSAVEDLSANQKEAALLYYYESLSVQEIAELLGVSLGAVKMRLSRARSQLREQIQMNFPQIEYELGTRMRRQKMVRLSIIDVIKQDQKYIVMLNDEAGERILPIWIGAFEGQSIAAGVGGFRTSRPLTFDFIVNMLGVLGAELHEVRIESLKETTFYGVAQVRQGDMVKEIDARPSDVLALAVRTGCPVYAAEEVMEHAAQNLQELGEKAPNGEGIKEILQELEVLMKMPKPGEEGATC